jgi:hypothetical protein
MALVRLVKRGSCVEDSDYAFDVSAGRRFVPSPDVDARHLPPATTTTAPRTVFRCPPPKCVRLDKRHAR